MKTISKIINKNSFLSPEKKTDSLLAEWKVSCLLCLSLSTLKVFEPCEYISYS